MYCTEFATLVYVNSSLVLGKGKRSARLLSRAKIYVTGPISMEGPKRMVRLSYKIPLISPLVYIYIIVVIIMFVIIFVDILLLYVCYT